MLKQHLQTSPALQHCGLCLVLLMQQVFDNCLYCENSAEEEGKSTLEEERKSRFGHINSILFQLRNSKYL